MNFKRKYVHAGEVSIAQHLLNMKPAPRAREDRQIRHRQPPTPPRYHQMYLPLFLLLILFFSLLTWGNEPRDQQQFSISSPFTSAAQNFDIFGSATLHSDTIVLTPHSPAHLLGAIWSKAVNPYTYWEAEFSFRASGAERGGTGLAFWYAARPGLEGRVFGSIDQWDGLGLFFDSNTGGKVHVSGRGALKS